MIKQFLSLVSSNLTVNIFGLFKGFVVAKYLGPAQYGILKLLDMIPQLSKYGDLGFIGVTRREIPYHIGAGNLKKAQLTRDVSYSSELILAMSLTSIGISLIYFYTDTIIVTGIISYSIILLLQKLMKIIQNESIIQKNFQVLSKTILVAGVISSLGIIITVPFIGIYSLFIVTPLSIVITIFYLRREINIPFKFRIEKKEFYRILNIGIPLSLGTVMTGLFLFSKKLTINYFFGIAFLGYYGIALQFLTIVNSNASFIVRMIQPRMLELLGNNEIERALSLIKYATKICLLLVAIVIGFIILNIDWFIKLVLPHFYGGMDAYYGLLFGAYINLSYSFVRVLLASPSVDKLIQLVFTAMSSSITFLSIVLLLYIYDAVSFRNIVLADVAGFSVRAIPLFWMFFRHFKIKLKEVLIYFSIIILPIIPILIIFYIKTYFANSLIGNLYVANILMIFISFFYLFKIKNTIVFVNSKII